MQSTLGRKLRQRRRLLLAWALVALAFPAASSAASWAPPRELSDADSAPLNLAATAGIGPGGNAVVLWHTEHGVQAVARATDHSFGKARPIVGSELSMPDLRPQLAFDSRGRALAVWS